MRPIILTAIISSTAAWAAPAPTPAPAANLLGQSSFEEPKVTGRTPETDEGLLPVDDETTPWAFFGASEETEGGKVVAGITDEIARTGKQSIYVDFEKVTANLRYAILMTKLIPVKPSQNYRLAIWGRIDRKRPLALDERRPFLVLDVDFYTADGKTKAGEPIRGFQLIPGRVVPGGPHPLLYVAKRWSESPSQLTTPAGTAFLQIKWTWQVPADPGETDGVIYFDDASLQEDHTPAAAPEPAPGSATGTAKENLPELGGSEEKK
jgi:hypothetical protein